MSYSVLNGSSRLRRDDHGVIRLKLRRLPSLLSAVVSFGCLIWHSRSSPAAESGNDLHPALSESGSSSQPLELECDQAWLDWIESTEVDDDKLTVIDLTWLVLGVAIVVIVCRLITIVMT